MHRRVFSARRMKVALAAVSVLAISTLALTGCSGSSKGGAGTTLTIAIPAAPSTLAPQANCSGPLWTLAYEPLINVNSSGGYRPGLATSWKYSDSNKVFTLTLRKNAQFADGTKVTAQSVVNTLDFYKKGPSIIQSYLQPITSITALNSDTVQIVHATPFAGMETLLSTNGECNNGLIISKTGLEKPSRLGTNTYGAGPYMLDTSKTVSGDHYTYVKNPHYYDSSYQHYSTIVVKVIPNATTALGALTTGQIQVDMTGGANLVSQAKSKGLTVATGALSGIGVMLWDQDGTVVPALKDVRVRQALAYALNRDAMAKAVGPTATALNQFALQGTAGWSSTLAEGYSYNVSKAKQLLSDAGYPNGFSMTILADGTDATGINANQAIVASWAAIGVKATVKVEPDLGTLVSQAQSKAFPAGGMSYALNGDVYFDAIRLYESPYSDTWNAFKVTTPALDAAYNALATASPADATRAAAAFNAVATKQVLVVPAVQTYQFVFAKGIDLGKSSPNGQFDYASWKSSK